jgi:hypothetical protein
MRYQFSLLFLCLFAPITLAQSASVFHCIGAAETNIMAVEEYLREGAIVGDVSCTRLAKGGYQMTIETDCKSGNYPAQYNYITISIDKSAGVCFSGSDSNGCEQIPDTVNDTSPQSNKNLARLKKIYRNRCANWQPPVP